MTPLQEDDSVDKAAEHIRQLFNTAVYLYSSNGDMTQEAITSKIALAWVKAKDDMAALESQTSGNIAARKAQLQQQVFGTVGLAGDPASLAMSARDASERVAQIDVTDWYSAEQLLDRAEMIGDEVLARQIAAAAYANPLGGWSSVLDSFLSKRPAAAQALDELTSLNTVSSQKRVHDDLRFVIPLPPQLAGMDDWRIQSLAAQVQE
ncbi:MAG: hypothetical protein JWO98_2248 [Frankiales bacterium]|nr:hypothetical protein [Frankiales bacterium]